MCLRARFSVAMALSFLILSSMCLAQGSLSFRTSLEITGKCERNPFLVSDEAKEDKDYVEESYVVQYSPMLSVGYAMDFADFGLSYAPYYKTYYASGRKRHSSMAGTGDLSAQLYFTDRLSLTLHDGLTDSVVGAETWSDDPDVDRHYTENSTEERIRYTPGTRLVLTVGHRSDGIWHRREKDKFGDREENFALGSVGYTLGRATEVGVTGDWGLVDSKTPDRYDDRYEYSVRGYIEQRLEGIETDVRVEGGVETTEYKHKAELEDVRAKRSSFSGSLSVRRVLGEDTRAELTASSSYESSDVWAGEFYENTSIRASLRHLFFDRVETILSGTAGRRKYTNDTEEGARRDYTYRASAVAGYRFFRWLSLRAGYTFAKVDSTIQTYEYENQHLIEASLNLWYSYPG